MSKSKKKQPFPDIDWDSIVGTIKSGKCVFLVGPEISSSKNVSFQDKLLDFLTNNVPLQKKDYFVQYFRKHQLFEFSDDKEQAMVYQKMQPAYESFQNTEILDKITAIAVPLVISLNPDLTLKHSFEKYQHQFLHYSVKPLTEKIDLQLQQDNPLLYYLFGKIDQPESLIFTYDDLLNYIFSLLGKSPDLPLELKSALSEAQVLLFLGFRFEQWYMQLIVRILIMQGKAEAKIKYAFDKARYQKDTYLFYTEHFNVNFLDLPHLEFVNQLYERCLSGGLIRKPIDKNGSSQNPDDISLLIENDELEDAINALKKYFKDLGKDFETEYDESISISSRLKSLNRNQREGILSTDDITIERARLRKACRELLKIIEA